MALARRPGVSVTGPVPDVRPYLSQSMVAVAPLLVGRGVQNKVLEAMATPVVATSAAFRGVGAPEGEGIRVADTPEAFAGEVVRILRDPAFATDLGRRGRRFVERHRVWEDRLARLEAILEEAVHARHEVCCSERERIAACGEPTGAHRASSPPTKRFPGRSPTRSRRFREAGCSR